MRKLASILAFAVAVGLVTLTAGNAFGDEEGGQPPQQESNPGEMRGTERVPGKSWDEAWRGFFGRDLPDPLNPPNMSGGEWQHQREEADRHAQAGADFTQAATSVVTAGAPSPTAASGVATQAIGEGAQAIVDAGTTAPPEQPSAWQRFCNWVSSWFK